MEAVNATSEHNLTENRNDNDGNSLQDIKSMSLDPIDTMSDKEKKILDNILLKYSFESINILKVRSSYKVETLEGNLCFKKRRHGKFTAKNGIMLLDELKLRGFTNIVKCYKSIDNSNYVKYKDSIFYVVDWIDGELCDMSSIDQAVGCVKLLAQYDSITNTINTKKFKLKDNLKNWPKIFKDKLQDLEKFERMITKKKIKNEFDSAYYSYIEDVYQRGLVALNFLNNSDYYKLSHYADKNKTICNYSFYEQNIIYKDNKFFIVDIDNIAVDLHINNLGKLIRKLMFKKSYQWDFTKAKLLIEAYNSIRKLDKNELSLVLAFIIFPHKFWKLGKKRYIKHKGWDELTYMHKLTRLIKYNNIQNSFLADYMNYMNSYE
ncbi:CotS family spore coat protein [Clostridium sp. DJ247]|uniref:CotS family spore coat protein n=1 Tax=Clostridium sp. DJ247 TaxID=2726188 RepID=UPI001628B098|nr:CotS family spore coat protein [Clostridium sp. DJ247]MBC2581364.1 CotS family spore coat protein [Clostridium sp. DJ247]